MVAVDLKSVERSSRIRPTSTNCSDAVHGEQRKKKESKARRREKWGMWRARERGVVENERGNLANAKERGEHEHQWLT